MIKGFYTFSNLRKEIIAMAKRFLVCVGIVLFQCLALWVFASEGRLKFVETEVILFPNGKSSIEYVVRYQVISGEFHGFYFGGFDRLIPYFDQKNASAIDSRGTAYGLDIKK